jgi:cystathionine gamma-synthase
VNETTHGFETLAIHAGQVPDARTGAVAPAIWATSTYKQDGVAGLREGYEYSRTGNPTRAALEGCIAALEGGARGFAFASGMAAEDTVLRALTRPGDHVVIPDDAYGGTYRLFDKVAQPWGLQYTPASVADVEAVRAAVRPGSTKIVWVETPTNPLLGIADIAALAEVAHEAGALLVVDTRSRRPTAAADRAGCRSRRAPTTKYCGGHSDVVGARSSPAPTSSPSRWRSCRTPSGRSPGRSTHGWCFADCARWRCGWNGTVTTPSSSSTS